MADNKTLKDVLEQIKVKGGNVVETAGEIQRAGNFAKELAEVAIDDFDNSPLNDHPTTYLGNFQSVLDNLGKIETNMGTLTSLASGVSYGTASAMTIISGTLTPNNYRSNPNYAHFFTHFDQVIDQGQTKDQVISKINSLNLSSCPEGKQAITLLEAAWDVHTKGDSISTSSLIPLRESIEKTLQAIRVKTPPPHTKLKKWIIDLGSKVCHSYVTSSTLQTLQDEHEKLRDELSGSKSGNYDRERERILVREATLHLIKILDIIDPKKLK